MTFELIRTGDRIVTTGGQGSRTRSTLWHIASVPKSRSTACQAAVRSDHTPYDENGSDNHRCDNDTGTKSAPDDVPLAAIVSGV